MRRVATAAKRKRAGVDREEPVPIYFDIVDGHQVQFVVNSWPCVAQPDKDRRANAFTLRPTKQTPDRSGGLSCAGPS